ncbi:hypothetical protein [Actinoplanes sp. TFC3]|uniref:hypothetical protein n=1 Tax=Actinoplanes sp. TFC3 TaxID=1710355 RepID=UPI00128FD381|nr:hypothetical protein [Actinoplanes sp. TFC3]
MSDDVFPTHVKRSLRYLALLNAQGIEPTVDQLDAFALHPTPVKKSSYSLVSAIALGEEKLLPVSGYMQRLGWLRLGERSGVRLTSLGSALAHALEDQSGRTRSGPDTTVLDLTDAVLTPDDPETFERFTRVVSEAGEAVLADPYFKASTIGWVLASTNISRILMSDRGALRGGERGVIAARLAAPDIENKIEVRMTSSTAFHDRALVAKSGEVWLLGTSLNGVGRHLSSLVRPDREVGSIYRKRIESLWDSASVIEPQPIVEVDAATN